MNSSDMVYFAAQRTGFIELRTTWVLASTVSKIKWQWLLVVMQTTLA